MEYGRSLTYITEDKDWPTKILLAGLISLIPFIGQFYLMGYVLEALRNVLDDRPAPLPDATQDFGQKLLKGLLLSVIVFIYFLPLTIVGACIGTGGAIFPSIIEDADAANSVLTVWASCFGCLSLLYGILAGLLMPYVWSRFADTGQFGEAFKLAALFGMLKNNLGPTIVVLLITWLVSMAAVLVGLILCVVGLIFTMFYAQLVTAFLYASLYRHAERTAA
jgi:hypothetical protein